MTLQSKSGSGSSFQKNRNPDPAFGSRSRDFKNHNPDPDPIPKAKYKQSSIQNPDQDFGVNKKYFQNLFKIEINCINIISEILRIKFVIVLLNFDEIFIIIP